jgi:hypothetical protein
VAAVAGVVLAAGLVPAGPAHAAVPCTFFLAPNGDDDNAGTVTAPWASLEKARDHIRGTGLNDNMQSDIGVCLRAGRYTRTSTFRLSDADSGSNGHRVVYQAYAGETPIIDGGRAVRNWSPVSGKPYYVADVPQSAGYADYFRQLYVAGRRAQLAMGPAVTGTSFWNDAAIVELPSLYPVATTTILYLRP